MPSLLKANRTIYSILIFAFLALIYAVFPAPVYWLSGGEQFRPLFLLYSAIVSVLFWFLAGKHLERKEFRPGSILRGCLNPFRRREFALAFLIILVLKVFTIYAGPLWILSDESFDVHRGQAFLLYYGEQSGILPDTLGISGYQLEYSFNRYAPLSMIIQGLSFAFFGGLYSLPYILANGLSGLGSHFFLDEMAARFPSLVFTLLTFLVVYKLAGTWYDRKVSLLAAMLLSLYPVYFMLTSTALLTSGVVFFIALAALLFMKYLKTEHTGYLLLSAISVSVGVLYKRPPIFFALIILLYLLLFSRTRKRFRDALLYTATVAMISAPYFLMAELLYMNRFDFRPFVPMSPTIAKASAYLVARPFQVTLPLAAVALLAVFLLAGKNHLTRFSVFWFALWYAFFTLDFFTGDRITVPFLPALAVLSSVLLLSIPERLKTRRKELFRNLVVLAVSGLLLAESLVVFTGTDDIRSVYEIRVGDVSLALTGGFCLKNIGFPYREATSYLVSEMGEGDRVSVYFTGNKPAFFDMDRIFEFYIRNADGDQSSTVLKFTASNASSASSLYFHSMETGSTFLVIPSVDCSRFRNLLSLTYTEQDMDDLNRTTTILTESGLFTLEREFYSGSNGLLVFSTRNRKT